jgi:hypothetical protein
MAKKNLKIAMGYAALPANILFTWLPKIIYGKLNRLKLLKRSLGRGYTFFLVPTRKHMVPL